EPLGVRLVGGAEDHRGVVVLAEHRSHDIAFGPELRVERRAGRLQQADDYPPAWPQLEDIADIQRGFALIMAQLSGDALAEDGLNDRLFTLRRLALLDAGRREPHAAGMQPQVVDLAGDDRIFEAAHLREAALPAALGRSRNRLIDDDVHFLAAQR